MKTAEITLSGQTFTVAEQPRQANAAWRAQFQDAFSEAAGTLAGVWNSDVAEADDLAGLVRQLAATVTGAIDTMAELLFAYAPELTAQRETAYDSEILEAFTAVLELAYPFGSLLEKLASLTGPGQAAARISTNSRPAKTGRKT